MNLLPGFGGSPSVPAAPPPPPKDTDPAIKAAQDKLRLSEANRRGRAATMLTPDEATLGAPNVDRPEARGGAKLLGE